MTAFDSFSFSQMRRNRDVLFFSLNAFGWIAWGIGQYISFSLHGEPTMRREGVPYMLAVAVVTGFIGTTGLRYLCRVLLRQPPLIMIGVAGLAAYLMALPMRVIINLAQQYFV